MQKKKADLPKHKSTIIFFLDQVDIFFSKTVIGGGGERWWDMKEHQKIDDLIHTKKSVSNTVSQKKSRESII